jgi:hypothetical protein
LNIKPCMDQISGTWELLLREYWRKSMIIGEKNTDLKRLIGRLKLRFLTEIGRFHWNQGEKVAHFAWFGEPCYVYYGENKLHFDEMKMISVLYLTNTGMSSWIFNVLTHWNDSPLADVTPLLAEKQQIPIA